ncbi:MAG TPA: galactitol-1-phosphate 5-dehydrogenase [Thermoflexales bacterium]|nr:galactitol-1-phosphate 5-dehydrogenase [Thermoflexales bacterium]HQZ98729.1 galactitol-1-phosphate 5-dehydrogenase [Thermoflexales bacterium]
MQAVILKNKGVMEVAEVETPTPAAGNVLLRVHASSICGSDIHRYVRGHREYPMILGHESAGVIAQVGAGVSADKLGKHAAIIPLVPCFECPQCQRGLYSACQKYSFIGSRRAGGFAQFVELPERNAFIIPDELSFEDAALIEPSTVARHFLDRGGFMRGQTALVLGAGSIGLMTVQWLRILGASQIFCSDVVDENLQAARELGAHITLNAKQVDVAAEVKRLTGDGVDVALEVAGVPQTLAQAVQAARPRGAVVCGGNQPLDASLPMALIEEMMRKELSMNGCFMSYSAPFPGHEWTETVTALMNGGLRMPPMISHRFPLSQTPSVFKQIGEHALSHRKIILKP